MFQDEADAFDQVLLADPLLFEPKAVTLLSRTNSDEGEIDHKREFLSQLYSKVSIDQNAKARDWNKEFVGLRLMPTGTPGEQRRVLNRQQDLIDAFDKFVQECARCIMLEDALDIPREDRVVPQNETPLGVAGGSKYTCGRVRFKYAGNVRMPNQQYLYDSAMNGQKTASAELRSQSAILQSDIRSLNITLSCVVYIGGQCIMGTAMVPISGSRTIAYGSEDAGMHIYLRNTHLISSVVRLAEKLRLKPHRVSAKYGVFKEIVEPEVERDVHEACDKERQNEGKGYTSIETNNRNGAVAENAEEEETTAINTPPAFKRLLSGRAEMYAGNGYDTALTWVVRAGEEDEEVKVDDSEDRYRYNRTWSEPAAEEKEQDADNNSAKDGAKDVQISTSNNNDTTLVHIAEVHLAVDVEGHVGLDGRFYLVDTARLMPPTPPVQVPLLPPSISASTAPQQVQIKEAGCVDGTGTSAGHDQGQYDTVQPEKFRRGAFMYELFRPEFMRSPLMRDLRLSADSFSSFGRLDYAAHHRDVVKAFDLLKCSLIPEAAQELDKSAENDLFLDCDHTNPERRLSVWLHKRGINVRFMGLLRDSVTSKYWKKRLLLDMVARCLKQRVRRLLRLVDLDHHCVSSLRLIDAGASYTHVANRILSHHWAADVLLVDLNAKFRHHNATLCEDIEEILRDDTSRGSVLSCVPELGPGGGIKVKSVELPGFLSMEQRLQQLEDELSVRETQLGPDDPRLRDTLLGMVEVYILFRGTDDEASSKGSALDVLLSLLDRLEELTRPPSVERGTDVEWESYYWWIKSIAVGYGKVDRTFKMLPKLTEAVSRLEQFYGDNHPTIAVILRYIGRAYFMLGRHQERLDVLQRAVQIEETEYGEDALVLGSSLRDLGNAFGDLGNIDEKRCLLERALAIKTAHYHANHYKLADTLTELGKVYGLLPGCEQLQEECLAQALRARELQYGAEHYNVAKTLLVTATMHGKRGNIDQQLKELQRVLEIREKHYGGDHVKVAEVLVELGRAHIIQGNGEKSVTALHRAVKLLLARYGELHDDVTDARKLLDVACSIPQ